MYSDVLIVGAGHGGAQTAVQLRKQNFTGSIALVGAEAEPPYERPPLSKDYLSGEKPFERILIRPRQFWDDHGIELILGERAITVDGEKRRVETASGAVREYRDMVWAAGGEPRLLSCSGHDLAGVHSIRNRADVDALMRELPQVHTVAIIGGGYIGLEAAAVLTELGKKVVLLEALDRVLARVAGERLSRFYEAEHRAHGADVRLNVSVACIEEKAGRAVGVRLADGAFVGADLVVVGIGIIPAVQPLIDAGAEGTNGIDVDGLCRTSLPHIYAIGDCAAHVNAFAGDARIRLESVQNATDQAIVAAKAICGNAEVYQAVPWFWSEQYDLRLQTVGISTGADEIVVRGVPETRSFSVIYLRDGRVIALDCVNATRDYVQGRTLVGGRMAIDPALLADSSLPLKSLTAVS